MLWMIFASKQVPHPLKRACNDVSKVKDVNHNFTKEKGWIEREVSESTPEQIRLDWILNR